jgi:ParB/RepB/Spo0J family partition protein
MKNMLDFLDHLAYIDITDLCECRIQLRPVDKRTVQYQELHDSIQTHGLWQPLLVRPATTGFEVIDGFYRFNCCKDLRFKVIPCLIRDLTDKEVLIVQIQCNAIRLETDPIDFARQMWRIIKEEKSMTVNEMAYTLKKEPAWVRRMLGITRLCKEASIVVKRGDVGIEVAYFLAKLPPKIQRELLPQAIVYTAVDFLPIIKGRVRKFKDAIKTGRMEDYYRSLIEPVPHLRKMRELIAELRKPKAAGIILIRTEAATPIDGWNACMEWVLHMDLESIKEQKDRLTARRVYEENQAEKRKLDRQSMREEQEKNDE